MLSARAAPEAAERLGKLAYLMSEVIREVIKENKERQSEQYGKTEAIRGNQSRSEAIRGTQRQS